MLCNGIIWNSLEQYTLEYYAFTCKCNPILWYSLEWYMKMLFYYIAFQTICNVNYPNYAM